MLHFKTEIDQHRHFCCINTDQQISLKFGFETDTDQQRQFHGVLMSKRTNRPLKFYSKTDTDQNRQLLGSLHIFVSYFCQITKIPQIGCEIFIYMCSIFACLALFIKKS